MGIEVTIRHLTALDLTPEFIETLEALAPVGIGREELIKAFQARLKARVRTYVALHAGHIVGTASLMIEPKFIHAGKNVAHVEDVVVRADCPHQGVGKALMDFLEQQARDANCYKIILDCSDSSAGFYEKLGFRRHEHQMRKDL